MMNFIRNNLLFFLPLMISCGADPILERANSLEKTGSTTISKQQQDQPKAKKDSTQIAKAEPPNVELPKVEPPKVEPPKPLAGGSVDPPPKNPKDGPFVTVSGTISIEKWSGKSIRIDVFDGDQRKIGGERPSVIVSETLTSMGSYEIHLPLSDKQLWIGAYIDEDSDGRPGPKDPSGWYSSNPLSAKKDHSSIDFELDVPNDPAPKPK